jgi:SAM domain (Sterile alpha motif)
MQQIADWLKKLGLPECGERFAENGIDVSVLPHLTDQHLKNMGVLLGHRRKMLAAIGELSSQPAAARAPATDTPIGPTVPPIAPAAEAAAERRYLTVMFCDLADSTGIGGRPRCARVCAQGLFADPGISRDRGSANAFRRAGEI